MSLLPWLSHSSSCLAFFLNFDLRSLTLFPATPLALWVIITGSGELPRGLLWLATVSCAWSMWWEQGRVSPKRQIWLGRRPRAVASQSGVVSWFKCLNWHFRDITYREVTTHPLHPPPSPSLSFPPPEPVKLPSAGSVSYESQVYSWGEKQKRQRASVAGIHFWRAHSTQTDTFIQRYTGRQRPHNTFWPLQQNSGNPAIKVLIKGTDTL